MFLHSKGKQFYNISNICVSNENYYEKKPSKLPFSSHRKWALWIFFPENPNISTISFPYPNYLLYLCRRFTIETMEEQNHIDKALAFLESLEKLGNSRNLAKLTVRNTQTFHARAKDCRTSSTNGALSIWSEWKWWKAYRWRSVSALERSNYNSDHQAGTKKLQARYKETIYIMNARTLYIYQITYR